MDPLAGMTREEARELVAKFRLNEPSSTWNKLLALAALGAECVGAKRGHVCGSFDEDAAEPAGIWVEVANCTLDEMPSGASVLVLKEDR